MSDKTGIQWTDATWNPVSGCSKVSAGCKNCYAERDWARLSKNPKSPYFGRDFTDVRCHPERLDQPLRWKRSRRIFVNSMSDLFHESVPFDFIVSVFDRMVQAPQHTFQVLTKRPERMVKFCEDAGLYPVGPLGETGSGERLPRNVHLGVSVENQETADERIPILLQTPAAVRFLSVEPLLEKVDLRWYLRRRFYQMDEEAIPPIDWVIVGGESGPNARPCNIEWIREIIAGCRAARVPIFVKQLGSVPLVDRDLWHNNQTVKAVDETDAPFVHLMLCDRKGGDPAEWPEDLRVREFPR